MAFCILEGSILPHDRECISHQDIHVDFKNYEQNAYQNQVIVLKYHDSFDKQEGDLHHSKVTNNKLTQENKDEDELLAQGMALIDVDDEKLAEEGFKCRGVSLSM
ncbi:hypothetical protein FRX31_017440 [Thalictrum thalictroides]|uniref:Uncharacterized protein n=1 Tax=Thalictrum thalictroides TaxID=46969 RepID=A0A7J6W7I4_THATH|nr:hypothetical protein FRX31_017440 [Thalictrum thalictroides]